MFRKQFVKTLFVGLSLILALFYSAPAQTKSKTPRKKATLAAAKPKTIVVSDEAPAKLPAKKNGRPEDSSTVVDAPQQNPAASNSIIPTYFYEFSQPDFIIERVLIEHDEAGKGKLSFLKKGYSELVSDPIEVSAAAMERINKAFTALNFLDSTENYQYEKDFAHLGTMSFRLKKEDRERTATFNWTQNKDAKTLADEYRRLGNQFIWIFDVTVARENQPLEAPKLMDSLESLIRRNEISDTKQMIPFLRQLSNDERIPLIARNHAAKLIKQIEKEKK